MSIHLKIEGLEQLEKALKRFPQEVQRTIEAAGEEAAKEIIETEGLKKYPPATSANQPPFPYYIRGRGTQTSEKHNTWRSEKLGTQWHVVSKNLQTQIGNRASYARYVVGEKQSPHMAQKGWKQLLPTAQSKLKAITTIYQKWINRLIKKLFP